MMRTIPAAPAGALMMLATVTATLALMSGSDAREAGTLVA